MSTLSVEKLYTVEEYFAIDAASNVRNEYFSGYIIAMAGNTLAHAAVVDNLARHIGNALEGRPCRTWTNMVRVKASDKAYVYPDIFVTCGKPEILPTTPETVVNPLVVIEVLSVSTQNVDRGEKFINYRKLESLQHYVLVAQNTAMIEVYTRQPNGHWDLIEISDLDAVLELPAIEVSVPLQLIYRDVEFPVRLEISQD